MAIEYAITTFDNPYSPFTQFDEWYMYDSDKGYNTCGLLDRIVSLLESQTKDEKQDLTEEAIDQIIKYDPLNVYKKIQKDK